MRGRHVLLIMDRDLHLRLYVVRDDRVLEPNFWFGHHRRMVWRMQVDPCLVQTRRGASFGCSERDQLCTYTIGLVVDRAHAPFPLIFRARFDNWRNAQFVRHSNG